MAASAAVAAQTASEVTVSRFHIGLTPAGSVKVFKASGGDGQPRIDSTPANFLANDFSRNRQPILNVDALDLSMPQVAAESNQCLPRRMQLVVYAGTINGYHLSAQRAFFLLAWIFHLISAYISINALQA
jgi:hypothetical protein